MKTVLYFIAIIAFVVLYILGLLFGPQWIEYGVLGLTAIWLVFICWQLARSLSGDL